MNNLVIHEEKDAVVSCIFIMLWLGIGVSLITEEKKDRVKGLFKIMFDS